MHNARARLQLACDNEPFSGQFSVGNFVRRKAAAKLHTLLDLQGNILFFIHIATGKMQDMNLLDVLSIELGAFYNRDKAHLNYARLYQWHHQADSF